MNGWSKPLSLAEAERQTKTFLEERLQVLIDLNVERARVISPDGQGLDDETILTSLHKARFETEGVPDELRHESAKWLKERGISRFRGLPWPPEGALP